MFNGCYICWFDIWLCICKYLAFHCWVFCFGIFVASLNKYMPSKCTSIVNFLYTNCSECVVCALIVYI
jgi:hypothetical protein